MNVVRVYVVKSPSITLAQNEVVPVVGRTTIIDNTIHNTKYARYTIDSVVDSLRKNVIIYTSLRSFPIRSVYLCLLGFVL
jgi:hypothetical protein